MNVIKRDGSIEEFDVSKIITAVSKAYKSCGYDTVPENVAKGLEHLIDNTKDISVEEIQDKVELAVTRNCPFEVAKSYIIYRYEHNLLRKGSNSLVEAISKKLEATNIANQNANLDEASFGGRIGEASRVITKQYALDNCMSKMARNYHLNNEIYIHDLDAYAIGSHNCLSIPFDHLLSKGFTTRQVDIRPANSINTAFQLVAVIFQLQSLQQFGGVSATHLDWTMVPYVRKSFYKHFIEGLKYTNESSNIELSKKDIISTSIASNWYTSCPQSYKYSLEMTTKELEQACEGLYHNLNSLQSRSGNQLPFTSVNYGTCTLVEGRMVTENLIQASIKGVGFHHNTPIFPCGIFQCMNGVNRKPEDANYDLFKLALKSTSLRMYPNYANVDWSGNIGYDKNDPKTYFSTMGCRTANGWDINGLGQLKDGRGNICPVTIILPTIAMLAKEEACVSNEDVVSVFFKILDNRIASAKDMLIERFNWICNQNPSAAKFMWENNVMAGYIPEEGIVSALKHGTLAVGQLGLAECLHILINTDHTTEDGMALAKRIEQLFADKCKEYKEYYKLNFGVYYTPAENLCYTAMKKFKDKYGIIPNVSDKEFFTNSMHVPVWYSITPFAKIDIESQLTGYSSAGCITYVELDSSVKHNIEGLETIVNYAMDHDIPYFAVNIPNDTCNNCGYIDEINNKCPICGSTDINRLRRVTGYLSTTYENFNKGKQDEVLHRVKHIKEIS